MFDEDKETVNVRLRKDHFGPAAEVSWPESKLHVKVGQTYVEWWNEDDAKRGLYGGDIELDQDCTMRFRFHESSRVLVMDKQGVRIYDSDTENDKYLIVDLSHEEFQAGNPPKVFDRSKDYNHA